jgi:hypothetical protein
LGQELTDRNTLEIASASLTNERQEEEGRRERKVSGFSLGEPSSRTRVDSQQRRWMMNMRLDRFAGFEIV